jgi:hypothetical protein
VQSIAANPPTCTVRVDPPVDGSAVTCSDVEPSDEVTVGESQGVPDEHEVVVVELSAVEELLGGCAYSWFDGGDWPPGPLALTE